MKNDEILRVDSISQLHANMGAGKPEHPLISVIDFSELNMCENPLRNTKFVTGYYSIHLKENFQGTLRYGRGYYDFEEGALYAMAPEQILSVEGETITENIEGWGLFFHPDLIRRFPLGKKIRQYGFFDYETNEALHLSESEKATLTGIVHQIRDEYTSGIDEFSDDVMVANIELLLSYVQRFYRRQFITRKNQNVDLIDRFEQLLRDFFESGRLSKEGMPSVAWCAECLNLSANYLSDMLKKETGKTAMEHIHYQLIEKAKNLLLTTKDTISEISYGLGFEYPYYFGRIFKKKTGMTPTEYRNLN